MNDEAQLAKALERLEQVKAERDALAARLERLNRAAVRFYEATSSGNGEAYVIANSRCAIREVDAAADALKEALQSGGADPGLARLKAQWQDEVLLEFADWLKTEEGGNVADCLDVTRYMARRQAEEVDE